MLNTKDNHSNIMVINLSNTFNNRQTYKLLHFVPMVLFPCLAVLSWLYPNVSCKNMFLLDLERK